MKEMIEETIKVTGLHSLNFFNSVMEKHRNDFYWILIYKKLFICIYSLNFMPYIALVNIKKCENNYIKDMNV